MKTPTLLALYAAIVIALALLFLRSGTVTGPTALADVEAIAPIEERGTVEPNALPLWARAPEVAAVRVEASIELEGAAPTAFQGPFTQVTGRVVDQDGKPLEGARIQLRSTNWPEKADVVELEPLGNEIFTRLGMGFEVQADAAGHFRVDAPFGANTSYELAIVADPMHDSAELRFGRGGIAAMTEGRVDVGEIRLAVTGSIFGTVTDSRGQPLSGARMDTGPSPWGTFSRSSLVREDGTFLLPHARVGTYMVKARLNGYMNAFREDVTVKARESTGPIHIILENATSIQGRFVDEAGAPIEKVRVLGSPRSGSSGAYAKSQADGTFTMYLPQTEPFSLEATHADYVQWGDRRQRDRLFEPGTHVGTITLNKLEQVRFTVVEKVGGEPLRSFGLAIARYKGSEAASGRSTHLHLPEVMEHPDGVFTTGARGKRDAYVAYAPGFLMAEGSVLPTEESIATGAPAQEVVLQRGGGVVGRLMEDGEPVFGASIDFTPGSRSHQEFAPQDRLSFQIKSGPDGRFRTTGLPLFVGVRLTARSPSGGAPILRMLKPLGTEDLLELGDLEFAEGGTVVGKVLLPEEIDPGGITVYIGDWEEGVHQVTDSAGAFRFASVALGEHCFRQRGRSEVLESGGVVKAKVEPGTVTEVLMDLRSQALVDVELEIDLGSRSTAGLKVDFIEQHPVGRDPKFGVSSQNWVRIGEANESGVAVGRCRAVQGARVHVRLPHGERLLHVGNPISVSYGPTFRERARFELGSIQFDLGTSQVLPDNGLFCVDLDTPGGTVSSTRRLHIRLTGGDVDESFQDWAALEGTELTLHGIAPGDWEFTAYAQAKDAPRGEVTSTDGRQSLGPKRNLELKGTASVRDGETTRAGS